LRCAVRRNLREQSALKSCQQSEAVALARQPLLLWLPAYRNLANQKQLLTPLNAEEIGITVSEEDQLDPEQSSAARRRRSSRTGPHPTHCSPCLCD